MNAERVLRERALQSIFRACVLQKNNVLYDDEEGGFSSQISSFSLSVNAAHSLSLLHSAGLFQWKYFVFQCIADRSVLDIYCITFACNFCKYESLGQSIRVDVRPVHRERTETRRAG